MRVTESMTRRQFLRDLSNNMERLSKAQHQLSTGKRISRPSDDPVGVQVAMEDRSAINVLQQYQRNITDAIAWQGITETAMTDTISSLHRLRELATQGANGVLSDEARASLIPEVQQLKKSIRVLANTAHNGKYIFAGSDTKIPPVDDFYALRTDIDGEVFYDVGSGIKMQVNVGGSSVFQDGSDTIFDTLDEIIQSLQNNDTNALGNALGDIESHMDKVLAAEAEVGARTNRLEKLQIRMDSDMVSLEERLSMSEEADMAETIMNLKTEEAVYRAALSAGARIIQPTLVDFLR